MTTRPGSDFDEATGKPWLRRVPGRLWTRVTAGEHLVRQDFRLGVGTRDHDKKKNAGKSPVQAGGLGRGTASELAAELGRTPAAHQEGQVL